MIEKLSNSWFNGLYAHFNTCLIKTSFYIDKNKIICYNIYRKIKGVGAMLYKVLFDGGKKAVLIVANGKGEARIKAKKKYGIENAEIVALKNPGEH